MYFVTDEQLSDILQQMQSTEDSTYLHNYDDLLMVLMVSKMLNKFVSNILSNAI